MINQTVFVYPFINFTDPFIFFTYVLTIAFRFINGTGKYHRLNFIDFNG